MSVLPAEYITGIVVLSTMVSLGDVDGDADVESALPSGLVTFVPVNRVTKTVSVPSLIIGNRPVTARVLAGKLVNAVGSPWLALPVGEWKCSFHITHVPITSAVIEVMSTHTHQDPLDLGEILDPGFVSGPSMARMQQED